ncbi:MAG: PqqD family protein [Anaerolineaceae bacterium]|nr:PqqD family protein [Anaerolineaceae bacterium]
MELNQKPIRVENFSSEIVDNEVILYNPDGNRFMYLNQTAALVWEQCTGELSVQELIQGLKEAFPAFEEEIQGDVEDTLQVFLKHRCITLV